MEEKLIEIHKEIKTEKNNVEYNRKRKNIKIFLQCLS